MKANESIWMGLRLRETGAASFETGKKSRFLRIIQVRTRCYILLPEAQREIWSALSTHCLDLSIERSSKCPNCWI